MIWFIAIPIVIYLSVVMLRAWRAGEFAAPAKPDTTEEEELQYGGTGFRWQ